MSTPSECTEQFDKVFDAIPELTWLPWVGSQWAKRPANQRLMIVAESFYAGGTSSEEREQSLKERTEDRFYARKVADECLIQDIWDRPNSTLRNISKLLFGSSAIDRARFWSDTAYYNLIQRAMTSKLGRPSGNDFYAGWSVFFRLAEILRPSFCLFIGVGATHSLRPFLKDSGRGLAAPELRTKVSRTRGRRATLSIKGQDVEAAFVQHTGRCFSPPKWHSYLEKEHPGLMAGLAKEGYAISGGK